MGRARKVDDNQQDIVSLFRELGCHVAITSHVGAGFPDLVVSRGGDTVLVEVKDGSKPPSKRRLTPAEERFRIEFKGWYEIVEGADDVLRVVKKIREVS